MRIPYDPGSIYPHIVGGREVMTPPAASSDLVVSMDAFTGECIWQSSGASAEIVNDAIQSARASFRKWANASHSEREAVVSRFIDEIKKEADELALMIAIEGGKPIWEAKTEVNSIITKLNASIEAYKSRASEMSREVRGMLSRTRFVPHGVVAVIGPFNFPASMANSHILPAILAGNTVVFKPSELTPITGILMTKAWHRAGLPDGVINCVSGGREVGEMLVSHGGIDGILFVGSYRVGMAILQQCATTPGKIVAVEMGGNNPLIIWDYKDIDAVVHLIIQSTFLSAGQRCTAARRLYVRHSDELLLARLSSALDRLQIGHYSSTPEPYYGPLIRPRAAENVMKRVAELEAGGATSIRRPEATGPIKTLVAPGLLDVTNCVVDQDEELFGPVLKVYRYDNLDEAIHLANATQFGLSAGIVCRERAIFEEFSSTVRAGIVNWNQQLTGATTYAPFGGIKNSGNHRPAGFLSVDYCSYPVASFELPELRLPDKLSPGMSFAQTGDRADG